MVYWFKIFAVVFLMMSHYFKYKEIDMHYSGSMQQAFYRLLDYGVRNDYLSFTGTYNRIRSKYYL